MYHLTSGDIMTQYHSTLSTGQEDWLLRPLIRRLYAYDGENTPAQGGVVYHRSEKSDGHGHLDSDSYTSSEQRHRVILDALTIGDAAAMPSSDCK
jgi:hypothetical protein